MIRHMGIPAAVALWAGLFATSAEAALAKQQACMTPPEVSALVLVLAPQAFAAVGTACAATLPPAALLRQSNGTFMAKYRAEAEAAWPQAKSAIGKIAGEQAAPFLETDMIKTMMTTMFVPMITKQIKPQDCGKIDHIVSLLEPLPPRNAAELITTILEIANEDNLRKGKKADLPICPSTQP